MEQIDEGNIVFFIILFLRKLYRVKCVNNVRRIGFREVIKTAHNGKSIFMSFLDVRAL